LRRLIFAAALAGLLAACAPTSTPTTPLAPPSAGSPAPVLRLSPAALGRDLTLQQRISVRYRTPAGEETREIQSLLQADATHTRLAAIAGAQVLARLDWDGQTLNVSRAPWAPAELMPERILSDLQLALWPTSAIEQALPPDWTLEATPQARRLRYRDTTVVEVLFPADGAIDLVQYRDGYALTIRPLPETTTR